MTKLSIIVPVYNVSRYLRRCIDSLSFLLSGNTEMIIVNDGSTDNSLVIAEEFAKSFSNVSVITQSNAGLSAARNTGLRHACGEYVWFVDSDDYICEDGFAAVYDDMASSKYDVIVFGRINDYGNKKQKDVALIDRAYSTGIDYFRSSINHDVYRTNAWDKIFRKDVILKNNIFFVEGKLYEDMLFCQHVFSKAGWVKQCAAYPYVYNLSNYGSITKQVRLKDLDVLWYVDRLKDDFMTNPREMLFGTKELNMLVFNWVNSCLLKKYIPMMKEDSSAKEIVDVVFRNSTFMNAIKYCASHRVLIRQNTMSWIILVHPYIYCRIVSKMLKQSIR